MLVNTFKKIVKNPLGLVTVIFLTSSLISGVVVVSNKDFILNISNKAMYITGDGEKYSPPISSTSKEEKNIQNG